MPVRQPLPAEKPTRQQLLAALATERPRDALIAAGWTPGDLRAAGWTPGDLRAAEMEWESIPIIPKLYTRLLTEIENGLRQHDQSTFGPDCATNLCKTRMCTAGHLVNMAGEVGYALREKYDFPTAARKNRPDVPPQNFGSISQELAMAYIRERATEEASQNA